MIEAMVAATVAFVIGGIVGVAYGRNTPEEDNSVVSIPWADLNTLRAQLNNLAEQVRDIDELVEGIGEDTYK